MRACLPSTFLNTPLCQRWKKFELSSLFPSARVGILFGFFLSQRCNHATASLLHDAKTIFFGTQIANLVGDGRWEIFQRFIRGDGWMDGWKAGWWWFQGVLFLSMCVCWLPFGVPDVAPFFSACFSSSRYLFLSSFFLYLLMFCSPSCLGCFGFLIVPSFLLFIYHPPLFTPLQWFPRGMIVFFLFPYFGDPWNIFQIVVLGFSILLYLFIYTPSHVTVLILNKRIGRFDLSISLSVYLPAGKEKWLSWVFGRSVFFCHENVFPQINVFSSSIGFAYSLFLRCLDTTTTLVISQSVSQQEVHLVPSRFTLFLSISFTVMGFMVFYDWFLSRYPVPLYRCCCLFLKPCLQDVFDMIILCVVFE